MPKDELVMLNSTCRRLKCSDELTNEIIKSRAKGIEVEKEMLGC